MDKHLPPAPAEERETPVDDVDIPRRCRMDRMVPAELAILKALEAVEAMAADIRLTDAVVMLGYARNRVADYVDGVETPRDLTRTSNKRCSAVTIVRHGRLTKSSRSHRPTGKTPN
jgi:hypothetical protein